jgi:hypothetical protein
MTKYLNAGPSRDLDECDAAALTGPSGGMRVPRVSRHGAPA